MGLLDLSDARSSAVRLEAFWQEIRRLGWIEGKNFTIESRFGEEKPDRLAEIATDLVRPKVDVIVCASTERKRVVDLAATYRLPAIYPQEEYMNVGGLMYYGFDPADNYRRADI